jgi:hypothetical protein
VDRKDHVRKYLAEVVQATVQRQSERDQQATVGPSDLSDTCDYCLAVKMAPRANLPLGALQHDGFSLKAWVGTAVHTKLEQDIDLPEGFVITEEKVYIHTIPGYGDIHGHVDVQFPPMETWGDYKTTDLAKLKTYRLSDVPWKHAQQVMMYGLGINRIRKMTTAGLIYIPRDSNNPNDIWIATADYDESIAVACLERAESIWTRLQKGDLNFTSATDCWVCNASMFRRI